MHGVCGRWADAGWHRGYTAPGGEHVPATPEVATPNLDALVKVGIDLNRHYVYKYCSPSRSALQSGRNPYHVNPLNAEPEISNPADPVSGFAAIPRNMTGIATKLAAAGYKTVTPNPTLTPSLTLTLTLTLTLILTLTLTRPPSASGTPAWRRLTTRRAAAATRSL